MTHESEFNDRGTSNTQHAVTQCFVLTQRARKLRAAYERLQARDGTIARIASDLGLSVNIVALISAGSTPYGHPAHRVIVGSDATYYEDPTQAHAHAVRALMENPLSNRLVKLQTWNFLRSVYTGAEKWTSYVVGIRRRARFGTMDAPIESSQSRPKGDTAKTLCEK